MLNNKKAFTLIELLVVIAIIGLLSSVVIVGIKSAKERAKQKKAMEFSHTVRMSLGSDLVGEWTFDDSTDLGKDSSGYENHGSIIGDPDPVDGIIRGAVHFNGTSGYMDCGNNDSLDIAGEITIEAWIKLDNTEEHRVNTILSKQQSLGSSYPGYTLIFIPFENRVYFYGTGIIPILNPASSLDIGDDSGWIHIVAISYGVRGRIYVHGVDRTGDQDMSLIEDEGAHNLFIGRLGDLGWYFDGVIDQVRVYNYSLSASEVWQLYAEGAEEHGITLK